jgi:hypothetical protein
MNLTAPPRWSVTEPYQVTTSVQGHPRSKWLRQVTGSSHRDIVASFTAWGGNLAWATISDPVRFHALFTGQPGPGGGCRTQLVLLLPATLNTKPFQALALLFLLLHKDHCTLERLRFTGAFAAGDEPLSALADAVDRMPVW